MKRKKKNKVDAAISEPKNVSEPAEKPIMASEPKCEMVDGVCIPETLPRGWIAKYVISVKAAEAVRGKRKENE